MSGSLLPTSRRDILQVIEQVDRPERKAIKRLFGLDLELAEKVHVSGFIERLVRLSDRAEDRSDLVALVVAARRV